LSLAAVPVGGAAVRAETAVPVLRLVWVDPSAIASGSELVARAEATTLLTRMGATVSWRRATAGEVMRTDEVWIILVGAGPPRSSGSVVLGSTRRNDSVAPVVWIRLPNVRAAVGIPTGGSLVGLPLAEVRPFAVALGRVIAHEVVHALVPSIPHGTGLMSGSLTRRQLTAASIPVEPEVALLFQAALQGDPGWTPSGTGVLAAEARLRRRDR
jgi:hypothetical protein